MFIKRTVAKYGEKTYVNHLLVESVNTPAGPRHKVICNLGHLDPGPKEEWLDLADRIQAALGGQPSLFPDPRVEDAVRRVRTRQAKQSQVEVAAEDPLVGETVVPEVVPVKTSGVQIQDIREVGPLHVGHQIWQRLELDAVLKAVGLSIQARQLTEVMTLNRLIHPTSELAMVDWASRVAIADVLATDPSKLNEDKFYRNLDTLHGKRVEIERELHAREKSLFNLQGQLLLYDLTNTHFEGQMEATPKAKRGHNKQMRTDCKQVAMSLMLDGDGFHRWNHGGGHAGRPGAAHGHRRWAHSGHGPRLRQPEEPGPGPLPQVSLPGGWVPEPARAAAGGVRAVGRLARTGAQCHEAADPDQADRAGRGGIFVVREPGPG
jgi:hypothetical protein